MKRKITTDVVDMFQKFQHDVLEKKPAFDQMFSDVQMMQFKVRPVTGDIAGLVEAGTQLGTGVLAGHGAMGNKGILLDKSAVESTKAGLRGQTGSPYLDKAFAPEAEKIMAKREKVVNEIVNLGAGEAKKNPQSSNAWSREKCK